MLRRLRALGNLRQQESAPDAAGLEPSLESTAQVRPTLNAAGTLIGKYRGLVGGVSIRSILILAAPTLAEQFLLAAIGITDTKVAGQTGTGDIAHAAAAAAVGAMTYLGWFASLMTTALGVGATAIVARTIGAHRPRLANRVAGTVCTASFFVGTLISLFFFAFPYPTVRLFGLDGLAADLGAQYLRIMSITICFQTAGQIGMACLRGAGDMFWPMVITLATTLINGVASPALTFGWGGLPAMGIRGNALGTLLAFAVAGILTLVFLLSGTAGLRLRLRHFKILPHLLWRVLRIGVPSWLEGMLLWGGQVFIVYLAITPTDKAIGVSGATLAAHTATLRIESLAFLPGFGFGIACSTLVGQCLGAGSPEEASKAARLCEWLAFGTMTCFAAPMVIFPRFLLGFMVDSEPVIRAGLWPLVIAGLAQPGFAIGIIKSSALKGAGATVGPMLATMTGMVLRIILVVSILWAFIATGHAAWGLTAVWLAIFIDLNYRAIFNTVIFRRGKWRHQKV